MNSRVSSLIQTLLLGAPLCLLAGSGFAADRQCTAYFIQLFATSVPAKANTMEITLTKAGFNTSITPFHSNGKILYRVRTGPYSSKKTAIITQKKMKSTLKDNESAQNSIIATGSAACDDVFSKAKPQAQHQTQSTTTKRSSDCDKEKS